MALNKYCNLFSYSKIRDEYYKINDGFKSVQDDISLILAAGYDFDVIVWDGICSDPDENGIATVISYKRVDDSLFMQLRFIDRVDGVYTKCQVTYYEPDGATVKNEYVTDIPGAAEPPV